MPIMAADISSGTKLFVWDGEKVGGTKCVHYKYFQT